MNQIRRLILTVIGVIVLGGAAIFASFAIFGFPFPSEPASYLIWIELGVLGVVLGIPFIISRFCP